MKKIKNNIIRVLLKTVAVLLAVVPLIIMCYFLFITPVMEVARLFDENLLTAGAVAINIIKIALGILFGPMIEVIFISLAMSFLSKC